MEQYKLLNLNGEYVKLYVTTNQTLPKLLKNSGSLVVFHDINYNNYWVIIILVFHIKKITIMELIKLIIIVK